MLRKLGQATLWVIALLALAVLCWVAALYWNWPLWGALLLFAGILLALWAGRRAWRLFRSWRLRRKLAPGIAQASGAGRLAEFDAAWRDGVRLLKRSKLSRLGGALYALPWFLVLGASASGKSTLLTRTRLSSAVRLVNQGKPVEPTRTLDWWYFDRGVVIEPAGRIFDSYDPAHAESEWKRLIHWFLNTRRREPLNGIVLTVSVASLMNAETQQLADQGQEARARIDALMRVFEARIPTYLVLTQCDAIPGFVAWGKTLSPEWRNAPLGVAVQGNNAADFVRQAFEALRNRLADLRIEQGKFGDFDSKAFFLPEHVAQLEARIAAYLSPAFDENPYGETPVLGGLYLTAEVTENAEEESEEARGWFSQALFNDIFPARRAAYLPLAKLGLWHRFLRHRLVIAWFALCVGIAGVMTWSYVDVRSTLGILNSQRPQALNFSGDFSTHLATLADYAKTIHVLDNHEATWLNRWLPFEPQLRRISTAYHAGYCAAFEKYALRDGVDHMLDQRLGDVSRHGSDEMIAAYAQHLVRRINLIDAALNHEPVASLPAPGSELSAIRSDFDPHAPYDPLMNSRFRKLYVSYIMWQGNQDALVTQRSELHNELAELALQGRPISWMLAWVDLQENLAPVTLASFWHVADRPDLPRVPAAYTQAGHRAIYAFVDELVRANGNDAFLKEQRKALEERFHLGMESAWFRFAAEFSSAPDILLQGEGAWRGAFAMTLTSEDPYLGLIHAISQVFQNEPDVTPQAVPHWAQLAIQLDQLLSWARANKAMTPATGTAGQSGAPSTSVSAFVRLADIIGRHLVRSGNGLTSAPLGSIQKDAKLAQGLADYRQKISEAIADIQKGSGHATKVAADTYGFSEDPSIKDAPLIDANRMLDNLSNIKTEAPGDVVIWNLVRGPLLFTLNYVSRAAACNLQQQWTTQVLAPLQGVTDTAEMGQALYAGSGLIPTFMSGPAKPFVERDAVRYRPREVLGQSVPLNGAFYAFVSHAQLARANADEIKAKAEAEQKKDANDQRLRDMELRQIEQQMTQTTARIEQLRGMRGAVKLSTQPIQVNPGATLLPQQVSLVLQCTGGATTLNNYNFPQSATFEWSMASCGDVAMSVQFPNVTLTKHWRGPQGFIDFLRDARDGQYTLDLTYYPNAKKALADSKIEWIKVTYLESGQETLLANFAEADRLMADLKTMTERRAALQAANENATASANDNAVATKSDASPQAVMPPTTIAACWGIRQRNPNANATALEVVPTISNQAGRANAAARVAVTPARAAQEGAEAYAVQVGVFADPARAREGLASLGMKADVTEIQRGDKRTPLFLVRVSHFENRAQAEQAAEKIQATLDLEPLVVSEH